LVTLLLKQTFSNRAPVPPTVLSWQGRRLCGRNSRTKKEIKIVKYALTAVAVLAFVTTLEAQEAAGGGVCDKLTQPYMSTTSDLGQTYIPFRLPNQQNLSMTWGIGALDDAGTLLMHADDALWGSESDGCQWRKIKQNVVGLFSVATGPAGYGYAWASGGGDVYQVHHDASSSARWVATYHKGKVNDMVGLGVDLADPLHVRTAGGTGQQWESFDGGATWGPLGVEPVPGRRFGYIVAYDPNDLDHAVFGHAIDGGFVTFDGGQTWTQSTGLVAVPGSPVNFFNAVISPVDGATVFATASDRSNGIQQYIYASTDGGMSYTPVLADGMDGVLLHTQPAMEADSHNANILRFLFSTSPAFYGSYIYEYDLSAGVLRWGHNANIPRMRTFESSRVSPGSIHVGFDYYQ